MRKKVSFILITMGILIILYPLLGKVYNNYQKNKLLKDWVNNETITQETEDDVEENYNNLAEAFIEEPETEPEPKAKDHKPKVLGTIEIKKINVNIPIIVGTTQEDLKWGAGYFKGTAPLGQVGNSALAGHRSYTFGEIFNRLNEVKKGDRILATTKEDTYEYQVFEIKVVEPTDFSVLEPKGEKKVLTLITCEPIYIASHRLVVHAELIE